VPNEDCATASNNGPPTERDAPLPTCCTLPPVRCGLADFEHGLLTLSPSVPGGAGRLGAPSACLGTNMPATPRRSRDSSAKDAPRQGCSPAVVGLLTVIAFLSGSLVTAFTHSRGYQSSWVASNLRGDWGQSMQRNSTISHPKGGSELFRGENALSGRCWACCKPLQPANIFVLLGLSSCWAK
jgi:hypothetical protein